jgi:hypothetical protein
MQTPNLPAIRALRPAWNKGRIVGQKLPLKPKHVWAIRVRLELAENHRDLALFNMANDSKLRGCDLVRMKVVDVMASGQIKARASVLQSKTQKPVRFEVSMNVCTSQRASMPVSCGTGCRRLGWRSPLTAPIQCGGQRSRKSTRKPATCVLFSFC